MEPKWPKAKKKYWEQIPKHQYESDLRILVLAANIDMRKSARWSTK